MMMLYIMMLLMMLENQLILINQYLFMDLIKAIFILNRMVNTMIMIVFLELMELQVSS